MKDKKELLEQTIKEDLEKEAQEILRALETSDVDELSDEKQIKLKKKIDEKIEAYEFEKICNGLPEEYRDALRAGMELKKQESAIDEKSETDGEEAGENTRRVRKRKSLRVYVALAAVMVMALAVSISSVGDGRSLMKTIKSMVGEREVVKVNSGEDNKVIEVESEEEAYQKIKDKLEIEPVKIMSLPSKTKFIKAEINIELQVAELYYLYNNENIVFIVSGDMAKNSMGIDVEDKQTKNYTIDIHGVHIEIISYETDATRTERYCANFNYKNSKYFLMGVMNQEEFEEILYNLYFY